MVKIIEKTDKERALEEKVRDLKKVTKQTIKDKGKFFNFTSSDESRFIFIHNYNIFTCFMSYAADCEYNSIGIKEPKHFDFALELVKKYEEHTGEEWTLRKDY